MDKPVDNTLPLPGINEDTGRTVFADSQGNPVCQLHIVEPAVNHWRQTRESPPQADNTGVVAKPCDVHAHDKRHTDTGIRVHFACAGLCHHVDGDEHVIAGRREVAQKLLPPCGLGKLGPQPFNLSGRDGIRFVHPVAEGAPGCVSLLLPRTGAFIYLRKKVGALGRTDEEGPALAVCQFRLDNFIPHLVAHLGNLIQNHTVEIQTSQRIRIVSTENPDSGAVTELDRKL